MIESGIVIGIGLLMILARLSWRYRMFMLSNPLLFDVGTFLALLVIHWGSFTGPMVATFGAMTCSLALSGARYLYGHVDNGTYIPGVFDIGSKLA